MCPPGGGGFIWHAQILIDGADSINAPFINAADGSVKPRRAELPVRGEDFLASLVRAPDGRWLFSGVLNGWPALTCLEVRSITRLVRDPAPRIERVWDATRSKDLVTEPRLPNVPCSVRATLRAPPCSSVGYAPGVPGFVWWYFGGKGSHDARFAHGEDILAAVAQEEQPMMEATFVHMFSHRYARGAKAETAKDRITYHSAILLEWAHGAFCTVVELATLNGVGGRNGKSNWQEDKLDDRPALYRAMPPVMVAPWKGEFAEIRCTDVPVRSLDEFKDFITKHTGPHARFVDPHFTHSGRVRLFHRARQDVARYLLNYMGRDRRYTEKIRNCQAFAADAYQFLAGKKDITVFSTVLQPLYQNRSHLFLYDPTMYDNPAV